MPNNIESTKTNTISTNDWLQATKHMTIHAGSKVVSQPTVKFTKVDFERDLQKVTRKVKK